MSAKTSYRRQSGKSKRSFNKTEAEMNLQLNSQNFDGKFRKERKAKAKNHEDYFKDLDEVDKTRELGK